MKLNISLRRESNKVLARRQKLISVTEDSFAFIFKPDTNKSIEKKFNYL
jgi:hypothetical protein